MIIITDSYIKIIQSYDEKADKWFHPRSSSPFLHLKGNKAEPFPFIDFPLRKVGTKKKKDDFLILLYNSGSQPGVREQSQRVREIHKSYVVLSNIYF